MGSAVGLWLFERRAFEDVLAEVIPWLETFCERVGATVGDDLEFRVRDGSAVGLPALDASGAGVFFLGEDEMIPARDEDYSAFSRPPAQGLVLGAGCSGALNHPLLGHVALAFAGRLDALIDFDGVLGHPTSRDGKDGDAALRRSRALVASLPGGIAEVSYDTGGGERWFRHVGDAEFLAAWLRHPEFHLVT